MQCLTLAVKSFHPLKISAHPAHLVLVRGESNNSCVSIFSLIVKRDSCKTEQVLYAKKCRGMLESGERLGER